MSVYLLSGCNSVTAKAQFAPRPLHLQAAWQHASCAAVCTATAHFVCSIGNKWTFTSQVLDAPASSRCCMVQLQMCTRPARQARCL